MYEVGRVDHDGVSDLLVCLALEWRDQGASNQRVYEGVCLTGVQQVRHQ